MLSQKEKELFEYMATFLGIDDVDKRYADSVIKALNNVQPTIKLDHGEKDVKTTRKN